MAEGLQNIESIANQWGRNTATDMKRKISQLGMHGKGLLIRSIRHKLRRNKGDSDVAGVAFNLERHGIFIDKGAGRGYGGQKTNNKQGSGLRPRRPWLWETLEANQAALAEGVANQVANNLAADIGGALANFKVK